MAALHEYTNVAMFSTHRFKQVSIQIIWTYYIIRNLMAYGKALYIKYDRERLALGCCVMHCTPCESSRYGRQNISVPDPKHEGTSQSCKPKKSLDHNF